MIIAFDLSLWVVITQSRYKIFRHDFSCFYVLTSKNPPIQLGVKTFFDPPQVSGSINRGQVWTCHRLPVICSLCSAGLLDKACSNLCLNLTAYQAKKKIHHEVEFMSHSFKLVCQHGSANTQGLFQTAVEENCTVCLKPSGRVGKVSQTANQSRGFLLSTVKHGSILPAAPPLLKPAQW